MRNCRFLLVIILLSTMLLGGCGRFSTTPPTAYQSHPGGKGNPNFIQCRQAIGRAYQKIVYFKESHYSKISYADWSNINGLLASSLSAMEFGHYKECMLRVGILNAYIEHNVAYAHWKQSLSH